MTILDGDLSGDDLWGILNRSDNSFHVVVVTDDAKLDGLTIRNGQADGDYPDFYGAGIYVEGGQLVLSPAVRSEAIPPCTAAAWPPGVRPVLWQLRDLRQPRLPVRRRHLQ